jgi:hypothetical protein
VSSNESITACVPTGTYFIRVYGFVGTDGALAANTYSLTWAKTSSTCGGGGGGGGTGGGTPVCGGSCGGIDYAGRCDGGTVKWCVSGVLQCATCGTGTSCGWDDDNDYYACLSSGGGGGGTTTPVCGGACGGVGYTGECSGSQVRWCENGTLSCSTCSAAAGESCGWSSAESYYDCVTSGGGGGGGSPVCGGSCGSIGYEGECNGTGEVRWCEGGVLRCQSCTGSESCGYDYGNSYYGCIDGGYSI